MGRIGEFVYRLKQRRAAGRVNQQTLTSAFDKLRPEARRSELVNWIADGFKRLEKEDKAKVSFVREMADMGADVSIKTAARKAAETYLNYIMPDSESWGKKKVSIDFIEQMKGIGKKKAIGKKKQNFYNLFVTEFSPHIAELMKKRYDDFKNAEGGVLSLDYLPKKQMEDMSAQDNTFDDFAAHIEANKNKDTFLDTADKLIQNIRDLKKNIAEINTVAKREKKLNLDKVEELDTNLRTIDNEFTKYHPTFLKLVGTETILDAEKLSNFMNTISYLRALSSNMVEYTKASLNIIAPKKEKKAKEFQVDRVDEITSKLRERMQTLLQNNDLWENIAPDEISDLGTLQERIESIRTALQTSQSPDTRLAAVNDIEGIVDGLNRAVETARVMLPKPKWETNKDELILLMKEIGDIRAEVSSMPGVYLVQKTNKKLEAPKEEYLEGIKIDDEGRRVLAGTPNSTDIDFSNLSFLGVEKPKERKKMNESLVEFYRELGDIPNPIEKMNWVINKLRSPTDTTNYPILYGKVGLISLANIAWLKQISGTLKGSAKTKAQNMVKDLIEGISDAEIIAIGRKLDNLKTMNFVNAITDMQKLKVSGLEVRLNNLQQQKDEAETQLPALELQIQQNNDRMTKLQQEINAITPIKTKAQEADRLKVELATLTQTNTTLNTDKRTLTTKIATLTTQIDAAQKTNNQLTEKIGTLQQDIDAKEQQIDKFDELKEEITEKIEKAASDLSAAKDRVTTLEQQLQTKNEELEAAITSNGNTAELNQKIQDVQTQLKAAVADKETFNTEALDLKTKYEETDARLRQAVTDKDEVTTQLQQLDAKLALQEQKNKELEEQISKGVGKRPTVDTPEKMTIKYAVKGGGSFATREIQFKEQMDRLGIKFYDKKLIDLIGDKLISDVISVPALKRRIEKYNKLMPGNEWTIGSDPGCENKLLERRTQTEGGSGMPPSGLLALVWLDMLAEENPDQKPYLELMVKDMLYYTKLLMDTPYIDPLYQKLGEFDFVGANEIAKNSLIKYYNLDKQESEKIINDLTSRLPMAEVDIKLNIFDDIKDEKIKGFDEDSKVVGLSNFVLALGSNLDENTLKDAEKREGLKDGSLRDITKIREEVIRRGRINLQLSTNIGFITKCYMLLLNTEVVTNIGNYNFTIPIPADMDERSLDLKDVDIACSVYGHNVQLFQNISYESVKNLLIMKRIAEGINKKIPPVILMLDNGKTKLNIIKKIEPIKREADGIITLIDVSEKKEVQIRFSEILENLKNESWKFIKRINEIKMVLKEDETEKKLGDPEKTKLGNEMDDMRRELAKSNNLTIIVP